MIISMFAFIQGIFWQRWKYNHWASSPSRSNIEKTNDYWNDDQSAFHTRRTIASITSTWSLWKCWNCCRRSPDSGRFYSTFTIGLSIKIIAEKLRINVKMFCYRIAYYFDKENIYQLTVKPSIPSPTCVRLVYQDKFFI